MPASPADNPVLLRLDGFIRKYYKNQLVKGGILVIAILVSFFLLLALFEHFAFSPSWLRATFFWGYLALFAAVVVRYILLPVLHLYRVGRVIDHKQAAVIIGRHFPQIADRLLNYLQLTEMQGSDESDLLQACIRQKTELLSPVPFADAVDFKANRKYVKYAAVPIVLVVAILLVHPALLTGPSNRIVRYNTAFQRPAPFAFVVDKKALHAPMYQDFELVVSTRGSHIPGEAYINTASGSYRMRTVGNGTFAYTFRHLCRDVRFTVSGGGVNSCEYTLAVQPQAVILNYTLEARYPAYVRRADQTFLNEGDISVPCGTALTWRFSTRDADSLYFVVDALPAHVLAPAAGGHTSLTLRAVRSFSYVIYVRNSHSSVIDTLRHTVAVIPDNYPEIAVAQSTDSTLPYRRLFYGIIKDDYGFSQLRFIVSKRSDGSEVLTERLIPFAGESTAQEFNYWFDFNTLSVSPGDDFSYHFQVCDNDAVHGAKCSESQTFTFSVPTEHELTGQLEARSLAAQQAASSALEELQQIQRDIGALMQRLIEKKELSWQDKQSLQALQQRQQALAESVKEMRSQMGQNQRMEQLFREQSQQLLDKQQQLNDLMNQVLDEQMRQALNEMQQMLQEVDKNKVRQHLENIQLNNKDLERQLDQDIDLMRRLDLEKRVEEAVRKTESLAEKQRQLSTETQTAGSRQKDSLIARQRRLSQDFQELKQELGKISQDYKSLDNSVRFDISEELQKSVEDHQSEAQESLRKGKNRDAAAHERSAADEMQQMADRIAAEQQRIEQEDLAEDAAMIRQMLKNIVRLSFNQEALIARVNDTYIQDPQYQDIIHSQNTVLADFRMIDDTLQAIARRQVQVASAVNRERAAVSLNIGKSLNELLHMNQSFYGTYKNSASARSMQYAMTSLNNLALVLAESLDNMQNQMRQNSQSQKNGNCKRRGARSQGACSSPGQGKPSPKSIRQMQDELNKQIEALKKQLDKEGRKPGDGRRRIGENSSVSESFARMVAQQEAIRRLMQQYGQEMKQQQATNTKLARDIERLIHEMEQTESDLVNKTITKYTIMRQQQISSRLLEHEKAEMQREQEERRQSTEATDMPHPSPSDFPKPAVQDRSGKQLLKAVPLSLTPFYRAKADDYLYK